MIDWHICLIDQCQPTKPPPWYVRLTLWLGTLGGAKHIHLCRPLTNGDWLVVDCASERLHVYVVYRAILRELDAPDYPTLLIRNGHTRIFRLTAKPTLQYIPRYGLPTTCVQTTRLMLGIQQPILTTRGLEKYLARHGKRAFGTATRK